MAGLKDAFRETANIFMRDQARKANQTLISARSMLLYIHAGHLLGTSAKVNTARQKDSESHSRTIPS